MKHVIRIQLSRMAIVSRKSFKTKREALKDIGGHKDVARRIGRPNVYFVYV